jgi:hypothetical protein
MTAVPVGSSASDTSFGWGPHQDLFDMTPYRTGIARNFQTCDVAPDGQRFLMIALSGDDTDMETQAITVVTHWAATASSRRRPLSSAGSYAPLRRSW